MLTNASGLSPADRAIVGGTARTGAQLLSYATPPVTGSGFSDARVFYPYVTRRVVREFNRQTVERAHRREAARRAAAGLPPFDPTVAPANLSELLSYFKSS